MEETLSLDTKGTIWDVIAHRRHNREQAQGYIDNEVLEYMVKQK